MKDTAKKVIAALSVAVIVLTILLGGAIAVSVIVVSPGRSDGTAWFYVDGTLYRAVKVENGTVSCPDVPTVAGMVFDGWYSDADYTGQKTTFPALIDGDTAFYARRIPISEADNGYMISTLRNILRIWELLSYVCTTRNIRSEETAMSTYTASSPTFPPMKRT